MERGDGVTQLAGTVAVEIFTAQKGHTFYFPCLYKHRVAGTPTTRGHIKLAITSGENNLIPTSHVSPQVLFNFQRPLPVMIKYMK